MATHSCCRLCEGRMKESEIAQSTLSALQSTLSALQNKVDEAIKQERSAQEQLQASLHREQELLRLLDEVKRENLFFHASLELNKITTHATIGEKRKFPPRLSQSTVGMGPETPALLMSQDLQDADVNNQQDRWKAQQQPKLTSDVELGTNLMVGLEASGEGDTIYSLEAHELAAISESPFSHEVPVNSGSHGERREKKVNLNQEDFSDEENEDNAAVPPSNSHATRKLRKNLDQTLSEKDEDYVASPPSKNNGTRKRKILLSSDDDDDEDYVASPPSKKKLFNTGCDDIAASDAIPLQKKFQHQELYRSSSTHESPPESPGREAIVEMEFGGGILVTEIPKHTLNKLKRKKCVGAPNSGCVDATQQPLEEGLRRSKRLSQSTPLPAGDHYEVDEIESSENDISSFSSLEESFKNLESKFEETHGPSKNKTSAKSSDLINSDSNDNATYRCRTRSTSTKRAEPQKSESSKSYKSSGSDQAVDVDRVYYGGSVNLLRPSADDDDSYDLDDSLDSFIVLDSSSSEETDACDEEHSSDSSEGDNGSQGTAREENVRKRQNLIWNFEGDMLAAIQNNSEIAMQAVCALYRQQTEDEQHTKGALHKNGRGFDRMNARRGSMLAVFLVDGDEACRLKKSAKALETRYPRALRICQDIAAHHSKQLFEIYSNKEDPFWRKPTVSDQNGLMTSQLSSNHLENFDRTPVFSSRLRHLRCLNFSLFRNLRARLGAFNQRDLLLGELSSSFQLHSFVAPTL